MPSPPRIGFTIDCPDPDLVAAFWEKFLGYERRSNQSGGTYVTIDKPSGVKGPPHLTFQKVPEPKVAKSRAHLDLKLTELESRRTGPELGPTAPGEMP